jgi:hypothetical protein
MKTIIYGLLAIFLAACSVTQVNSNIPKEEIRKAIRENLKSFQLCYDALLIRDSKAKGKVVIEWNVGESGKVSAAKVKSTEFSDAAFNDCMKTGVEKIEFPPAPKGELYVVSFPFAFKLE